MSSIILGLDPSFTGTGVVGLDRYTGEIVYKKLIATAASDAVTYRALYILNRLPLVDTDIEVAPELVAIENFAFSKPNQAHQLGYLGYRIREELTRLAIPYIEPTPNQVKQFATSQGNIAKNLILKEVYKRWGADFNDDNLADAYVLAQIGRGYLGEVEDLYAYQREVIAALRGEKPAKKPRAKKGKGVAM